MPSLTIKRIPQELLEQLKASAAAHRRSRNSEVLVRLERSVGSTQVDPESLLSRIATLQRCISLPPLTDELLEQARTEGRP